MNLYLTHRRKNWKAVFAAPFWNHVRIKIWRNVTQLFTKPSMMYKAKFTYIYFIPNEVNILQDP